MNIWWWLLSGGILIVAALSFYLGKLLFQIKQQQKVAAQAVAAQQRKHAEHQQYLLDSIVLIAKATIEKQCEYSEAALRIWVLLENLQPELAQACRFPGLFAMYDCVKEMPTHDAWLALEKKERRKLDHIRQQMEIDQAAAIEQDLQQLLSILKPVH